MPSYLLTTFVISSKLLNLFGSQFLHLQNGGRG